MSDETLKQLASEVPTPTLKVKFARILALGPDRCAQIDAMLVRGAPAREVVAMIQGDWNELVDLTPRTLERQIRRYRDDLDVKLAVRTKAAERKGMSLVEVDDAARQIDVMASLNDLCRVQMQRINKMLAREESMPLLLNMMKGELKLLHDTLATIANLQMELGVLVRVPHKVAGLFHVDVSEKFVEFETEIKNRDDLRATTRRIIDVLRGDLVDLPPDDGQVARIAAVPMLAN